MVVQKKAEQRMEMGLLSERVIAGLEYTNFIRSHCLLPMSIAFNSVVVGGCAPTAKHGLQPFPCLAWPPAPLIPATMVHNITKSYHLT